MTTTGKPDCPKCGALAHKGTCNPFFAFEQAEKASDAATEHRCSFTNDGFAVALEASGITDELWPRLVMRLMDEISKPQAVLTLPDSLSEAEAEELRRTWTEHIRGC